VILGISSEEINIDKDCRIVLNFQKGTPYNHPVLEDHEILINSVDNDVEDSFVLVMLLKINKPTVNCKVGDLTFEQVGFNVVPMFLNKNGFVFNTHMNLPLIDQELNSELFDFVSNQNTWKI
jgi:hypothetical protein